MSNRTLRRAAERQARKAEKKLNQQTAQTNNMPACETSGDQLSTPEILALPDLPRPNPSATPQPGSGPRTEIGKQISSRNALKHGSCSTATLILENESLDDFRALEKRWFQGYTVNPNSPDTQYEAELIRTAARADWFFQRADRNYAEAEAQILIAVPNLLMWEDSHHRTLSRFLRYRTAHTNTLAKHRKAIEDYRKHRAAELANLQKMRHGSAKRAIAKECLAGASEKSQSEKTWKEHLEDMRRQAIALGFTPKIRPTASQ